MALDDYGALLRSGQAAVPDYASQEAQSQLLQLKKQELSANLAELQRKQQKEQQFHDDLTGVLLDPSASNVSALIMKHPEFADQVKSAWDLKDKAAQKADLTQMGEVYSAASNGKWDLAAQSLQRRIDADKAAGDEDPQDQAILEALKSGDPVQQKAALGMIGTHLAAVAGPDHFASVMGGIKGGYTLDAGATRYDDNGNIIARSPYIKTAGGGILERDTGGGDPASPGAQTTAPGGHAAATSVASALSSAGLPAPVVAGFMGNFHAEGGYDGAQGDGGSASGVAQWRGERAANFQRVIGKPVTEATPVEQAKFVTWEMQNPQAAGMTVKQRDAILAAKTPAQAAALIDQYYERSSGKDRQVRMSAANAFAGQAPAASSGDGAPPGYHWLTRGDTPDQYRPLTPAEVEQRGLDPSQQYQLNTKTGQLTGLGNKSAGGTAAPGNVSLSGPDYVTDLRKTNPALANQVQGVLDTRLAYPPATARSTQAQQLRAAVLQADPTYDEQAYKRRQTTISQYTPGHAGPGASMLSAATLINHLYDLAAAARELPDHTTAAQNAVSSWYAKQTNQPWLIKYNEGRKFVASELPKFLEGKAPTEGQVSEHFESYSPSKGKSGIQTALATDVDYLYGRYQPLLQAYRDNVGKDLNLDNYAPGEATRAKAAALEYYRTNGSLPAVVTSPQQAAKLPHGAVFVTPDGRVIKRH